MRIQNPYENIGSMVRHRAISHEHTYYDVGGDHGESLFQRCLNRGIDVFCGISYSPAIPQYPANGWRRVYDDWEFELDGSGNIIYELDEHGNRRYKIFGGVSYPIPSLQRVMRVNEGAHQDFLMEDGHMSDIANMVQIPNSEIAFFTYPNGEIKAGVHVNFLGSVWGAAVNAVLPNIDKYNEENGFSLSAGTFRTIFPLETLAQVYEGVSENLIINNKVFGTINHPGYSNMKDSDVDILMETCPNMFKAMEVYNHTDYGNMAEYDIAFYDRTLMRGIKLWCLSVNDWGADQRSPYYETIPSRGCNLLYLPDSYESLSKSQKAEAALDAYIAGSFSAVGFGSVDIDAVAVNDNVVEITFNGVMDSIIVDIDGKRSTYYNTSRIFANLKQTNTFVRFEAYKGNDFLFTQPFFVLDKIKGINIKDLSVLFDEKS